MLGRTEVWQRPYFARPWSRFVLLCITECYFSHLLREPSARITDNLKKKCIIVLQRADKVIRLIYIFKKNIFGNVADIFFSVSYRSDRYEILLLPYFFKCTTTSKNIAKKRYNTKYMYLLHILPKLCSVCIWNNSYSFIWGPFKLKYIVADFGDCRQAFYCRNFLSCVVEFL